MGLPNVTFSTYFYSLGKGKVRFRNVANNDIGESQITGKIFKTRFFMNTNFIIAMKSLLEMR